MEDSDDDLSDSSGFLNPGPVVQRPSGGGAVHRGIAHQPTIPKSFPSSFLPVGHHVDDAAIGTTTSRFASGQVNNPPSAATNQKQKRSGNTLVAGNRKKAPTSNESRMLSQSSNNPVPTTTGIRSRGTNYTQQELMDLLDRIDEYLPVLQTEWELVATAHKQNYPNRECDYKNLRRKFFDVKKTKKTLPNGDPCSIPYEVLRAKEIYQKIKERGQIENLEEDDGECAVGAADDNQGIGNMDNNCTEAGTAIVEATNAADPRSTTIGSSVARIGARPDRKKNIDHGQVNNFRELQQWMMWKDEENKREERRFRYEEERRREEERKEDRRREERRREDDRRRQDEDRKMMMQLAFMAMGAFMSRSGGTGGIASMDNVGGPISSAFGSYGTLRSNHNNNNNDNDDNSEDNEKNPPKDKKH